MVDNLQFEVVDFDKEDSRQAGEIRAALGALGLPLGPYHVLIAGQAMARNLVLVSRNMRGSAGCRGLRVEDWEA